MSVRDALKGYRSRVLHTRQVLRDVETTTINFGKDIVNFTGKFANRTTEVLTNVAIHPGEYTRYVALGLATGSILNLAEGSAIAAADYALFGTRYGEEELETISKWVANLPDKPDTARPPPPCEVGTHMGPNALSRLAHVATTKIMNLLLSMLSPVATGATVAFSYALDFATALANSVIQSSLLRILVNLFNKYVTGIPSAIRMGVGIIVSLYDRHCRWPAQTHLTSFFPVRVAFASFAELLVGALVELLISTGVLAKLVGWAMPIITAVQSFASFELLGLTFAWWSLPVLLVVCTRHRRCSLVKLSHPRLQWRWVSRCCQLYWTDRSREMPST